MKRRRKALVAIGLTAAMTTALLGGCGKKATPENLLKDMSERANKADSMVVNLNMEINISDGEDSMGVGLDMDMEAVSDQEIAHATGTMSYEMFGSTFSQDMELYTLQEGDTYVGYVNMDGVWEKTEEDTSAMPVDAEFVGSDLADYAEHFELKDELVEVNGEECYELTGELSGEIYDEMMDADMLSSLTGAGLSEEDITGLSFPCTINIYKESILPAKMTLDMGSAMSSMMEDLGITDVTCVVDMTFLEYDTVDEIVIPDEALDATETDDEDFGLSDLEDMEDTEDTGTDSAPAEGAEQKSELGDKWDDYTVQINDTVITLPCTMEDLENAGLTFDTDYVDEDYMVNKSEYALAYFVDDYGNEVMVHMLNNSDKALEIRNCLVGGIDVSDYRLSNSKLTIIFPGGVQIETEEDEVLKAYGEPDSLYEDEEYGNSYTWYESEYSFNNECEVHIDGDSGLVDEITLRNFTE